MDGGTKYKPLTLSNVNRIAFRPGQFTVDYESWPQVVELAATAPSLGPNENRGSALIDPDRDALEARMRLYLVPGTSWAQLADTEAAPSARRWARFNPEDTRAKLLPGGFRNDAVARFVSRPLDIQWAYINPIRKLWNEVRPDLLTHAQLGNWFLMVRRRAPRADDGAAMLPASCLGDQHVLHKDAYFVPIRQYLSPGLAAGDSQGGLFELSWAHGRTSQPRQQPTWPALAITDTDPDYGELLWWHSLAICYAPQYVADNPGGIAADWPRILLPAQADDFRVSAKLGKRLAALLDPLVAVPDLPAVIGLVHRADGTSSQPARGDLDVRAQWGIVQQTGVFPGRGKSVRRSYTEAEATAIGSAAAQLGEPHDAGEPHLSRRIATAWISHLFALGTIEHLLHLSLEQDDAMGKHSHIPNRSTASSTRYSSARQH